MSDEIQQPDSEDETDSMEASEPSEGSIPGPVASSADDNPEEEGDETGLVSMVREMGEEAAGNSRSIREILDKPGQPLSPGAPIAAEMQETIRRALNPLQDYYHTISMKTVNPILPAIENLSKIAGFDVQKVNPIGSDMVSSLRNLGSIGVTNQNMLQGVLRESNWLGTLDVFAEQRKEWGRLFGKILQSGFARSTQDFLATSEGLKYTSNRTVWHYTSGFVLLQVLNKGYVWSSAPQNLNDASEITHGIRIIKQAFGEAQDRLREEADEDGQATRKKIKDATRKKVKQTLKEVLKKDYFRNAMNEIYIISASADDDSLTLFRTYANGDGFGIGFDPKVELSPEGLVLDVDNDDVNADQVSPRPISGWYRVHYTPQRKKKIAEEFVQNAIKDIMRTDRDDIPFLVAELRRHILIVASTMKDNAFKDEREVRYITTNWSPLEGVVRYEHARNSIVPVLYIRTSSDNQNEPLPLRGIRCSPVAPAGIVRTIEGLLVQQGYKKASKNVRKSQQPFKG